MCVQTPVILDSEPINKVTYRHSTPLFCPYCTKIINTNVVKLKTDKSICAFCFFCAIGMGICCLFPFINDVVKDYYHFCPDCGNCLAVAPFCGPFS